MFAVLDFQVCKVAAAMLGSQRPLLHVDGVGILGLLLLVDRVVTRHFLSRIVMVLILKTAVTLVIRNFAHALGVDAHRLVSLLGHPEHLAHLTGSRRSLGLVLS